MTPDKKVRLEYYRFARKFLFFKIRQRCQECDITYTIPQQLMADVFRDKPVLTV